MRRCLWLLRRRFCVTWSRVLRWCLFALALSSAARSRGSRRSRTCAADLGAAAKTLGATFAASGGSAGGLYAHVPGGGSGDGLGQELASWLNGKLDSWLTGWPVGKLAG